MNRINPIALLIVIILVVNCTHTRIVSFTDPDAIDNLFHRIGVIASIDDLSDRLAIETKMVETLKDNGVSAVSSISLLPPTREFTVVQEDSIFKNNGVDALAIIQLADAGFFVSSQPMRVQTVAGKNGSNTTVSGGGTEHKAFGQLRVSLLDIETDQTVWVGDADARAFFDTFNPDWDMTYLLKASAKKMAKELISTGFVYQNK